MTKGATFALALLALLILLHNVNSIITDVNGLPTIDNSHQFQFYFLET